MIEAEVTPKVAVQDAEVSTFYQQNLERFKQGDSVHASHILFGVAQDATPAQKTDAKAKAQAALKEVRAGADFAASPARSRRTRAARRTAAISGSSPRGR